MGGCLDHDVDPLRLTSGNPVLVAARGISFALATIQQFSAWKAVIKPAWWRVGIGLVAETRRAMFEPFLIYKGEFTIVI